MKKRKSFAVILMAMIMLLTACGGDKPSDEKTDAPDSTQVSETKRDDINLTLNQAIISLNPFESNAIVDCQLYCATYETMFFYNSDGGLDPRVCESFEKGEDGKTYTVKIRDGVKFHNGQTMTAEDVAWSLQYAFVDGDHGVNRSRISNLESAVALDEKTVEIKCADTDVSFFNKLNIYGYILCKDEYLAAADAGTLGVEWVPYGTGPYTITSYNPDSEIKLTSFADYYRGAARIDKINYQILSDNNTISVAFQAGDLDYIVVPTAKWADFSTNSDYNTYLSPTVHTSFFEVNTNNNDALADKRVRQALAYAIDREAMCAVAYSNIAQPAYSLFNPDTVNGAFTPEELKAAGIDCYEYNPEKAKELLAEAGYPNGLDIGSILTINGSYWEKMATVFQSNLNAIGVTVEIELADSAACRARRKVYDYQLATTGTEFIPDISTAGLYFSTTSPDVPSFEIGIYNQEMEDAFAQIRSAQTDEEKEAAFLELNRVVLDETYIIPTFHKAIPYAYAKDLVCDEINTGYYYVYNFHWN